MRARTYVPSRAAIFDTMLHYTCIYSTRSTTVRLIIANDFPRASIVANCPGSGGTGAGLLGSHCARPSGDISAGNMCLDASTVSEELHVEP